MTGDAIPDMARIVSICDAFDAMTSHRPYRTGMPRDKATAIIDEFGQPSLTHTLPAYSSP